MDELTAIKTQLIDGYDIKEQAKSTPKLFGPSTPNLQSRPSVIKRKQLKAERRAMSTMLGPRGVSNYKGTKLVEHDDSGGGYKFRSEGFLAERVECDMFC